MSSVLIASIANLRGLEYDRCVNLAGNSGEVFATDRLIVRTWDPQGDAEAAFSLYGDPEVVRYLGANPQTVPDVETMRDRLYRRLEAQHSGDQTGYWAMVERASGEVIGALIFKDTPDGDGKPTGDYEIGWHLRRASWGQGFATEGAVSLIAHAFRVRPDLDHLIAIAYPQNLASLRVMAKAGMTPVGITTKYYGIAAMMYEVRRP